MDLTMASVIGGFPLLTGPSERDPTVYVNQVELKTLVRQTPPSSDAHLWEFTTGDAKLTTYFSVSFGICPLSVFVFFYFIVVVR